MTKTTNVAAASVPTDDQGNLFGTSDNPIYATISSPITAAGTVAVEQSDPSQLLTTVDVVTLPTTVYSGKKTVTEAGTAEALSTTQALVSGVTIKALSTNTGLIYVGGATVDADTGFQLALGEAVFIEIDDLATVYVDSAVSGEGVTFLAS